MLEGLVKELDKTSEVSSSAFRFRRDTSIRAEMLDNGLIELTEEPLNDDGAVSGVKVVGIESTPDRPEFKPAVVCVVLETLLDDAEETGAVTDDWLAGVRRGSNGISVSLAASAVSTGVDGIPIVPVLPSPSLLPSPSPLPSPLLPLSLLPVVENSVYSVGGCYLR